MMFFGLAEPQKAMLESYKAALQAGWTSRAIAASPLETIRAIDADAKAFVARLADQTAETPTRLTLTRWMWDGEFCGELHVQFDAASLNACSFHVSCVPWKIDHDYERRATQQIRQELQAIGIDASAAAAMLDQQPTVV
jgi:hypothetical protein